MAGEQLIAPPVRHRHPLGDVRRRLHEFFHDRGRGWAHIGAQDFYWRQLRDGKASADIDRDDPVRLQKYARLCGWTLAHAHARTGDAVAIAGYLGSSDVFDKALTSFAERYAKQNLQDYEVFKGEIEAGRLEADTSH